MSEQTPIRTDELRPGDRVWHPFDIVCFTVAHEPKPETGIHFQGEPGLRVTGTDDRGETVHIDVAPGYKWHRGPIRDAETAVRELGALPVPVGVKPLAAGGRARTMLDHAREALNARMLKDDLRLVLENVITYAAERQDEAEQVQKQFAEAAARVAELVQDRGERLKTEAALRDHIIARDAEIERLRARLAEYERPADEDPIRYTLTEKQCGADLGPGYRCQRPAGHDGDCEPTPDAEDDVTPQVAKLRSILAGQREQAEAARAVHTKYPDSEHCQHDGEPWPCPTVAALGETGGA
jgi:hypothetical protein